MGLGRGFRMFSSDRCAIVLVGWFGSRTRVIMLCERRGSSCRRFYQPGSAFLFFFGRQMTAVYSCFIGVSLSLTMLPAFPCARHQKLGAGFLNLQAWASCLASKRGLYFRWLVELPDVIRLSIIKLLYRVTRYHVHICHLLVTD